MKLSILDESGKDTGKKVDLSNKVFNIEPHEHVVWLAVRAVQANKRQGTHDTKVRSEVAGGGRKPFRQKGTGRARQGTIRAPHHVGGGRVFGPHPRKYTMLINKKVKALARKSVLSAKAKSSDVIIVKDFEYDQPETKRFQKFLSALDLSSKSVLLLTAKNDSNMHRSVRNIYRTEIRDSITFSTYDIIRAEKIVIQEGAVKKINKVLG
jgi:large subunit ribosomal protein L4